MSHVEMDDSMETKVCVKCGGENSWTYDDGESLFASNPETLFFQSLPYFAS